MTKVRYQMLALLFVNLVVNYIDRANISVANAALGEDFNLSNVELGYILSAFGWAYALLQIPGGVIADRFSPRFLYALCMILWSFATIIQGFAGGFISLFALRLAIGTFEAPTYPINNRVVTNWFPDNERALAIAIFVSGQFIGLAFLSPVLVNLQANYGWKGLFVVTGIAGLIWGIVWYLFYRDPLESKNVNQSELDYIESGGGLFRRKTKAESESVWKWENFKIVFSNRNLWGIYIGQFAVNTLLWFFLTWFPTYLVKFRGLGFIKSGYLASIPFLAACAGLLISGYFSDKMVKQGKSVTTARRTPIIIGMLLSVSIVGANYVNDTFQIIFFMSLAFFGAGLALISWVFVSLLSPKNLIGLTGGVFNFFGNLASIVVPIVIGYLAKDGDFKSSLVFVAVVGFIGACSYLFLVRNVERVKG
jgi:MFS transporter, ACS family, D-galactonate transporter